MMFRDRKTIKITLPLILLALGLMVLIPCAAFADGTGSAETVSTITASEDTRIEVDQDANVIRFFIDGEETMRLDDSGLYVRDNLSYGGKILDDGASSFSGGSLGGVDAE